MDIEKFLEEKARIINEAIEKYIPRKYDKNSLVFKLSPPRYEPSFQALNKAIIEPTWEFLDRGGKRWRPTFFLLVCEALGADPNRFLDFAIIPEVVHNGTLVTDDIEDSSELRRGKPCTYRLYGLDVAVNVGCAMFYLPLTPLIKNKDKIPAEKMNKIYEIYVLEMTNLSFGQATDIAWHKGWIKADEITEKQYLQMCVYKTGTLARMAAKMAAVLAGADDDMVEKMGKFAESIGVAFQIQDDILDLVGEEFAEKKGGLGSDITEGKRTLMVIYTLSKAKLEDKKRLIEILNMHTNDQKLRNEAIGIIRKYGAIKYAKRFAKNMVDNTWSDINRLLPPSEAKEKLRAFAEYLIERRI